MTAGRAALATVVVALAASGLIASQAAAKPDPEPVPEPRPSGVGGLVHLVPNPCPFWGCEGEPVDATVVAWRKGRIAGITRTEHGRYSMDLRPDRYTLVAYPYQRAIFCAPAKVKVPAGKHVRVDIGCHRGTSTKLSAWK